MGVPNMSILAETVQHMEHNKIFTSNNASNYRVLCILITYLLYTLKTKQTKFYKNLRNYNYDIHSQNTCKYTPFT
jgi:hypothetical protein